MMGIPICLFINLSISSTLQGHGLLLLELHCYVIEYGHHPDFQTLLENPFNPRLTEAGDDLWRSTSPCPNSPAHTGPPTAGSHHHVQLVFSIPKDGDSTSSLADLCQSLATLTVKTHFLVSRGDLPCLSFCPCFPIRTLSWLRFNQVPFWLS